MVKCKGGSCPLKHKCLRYLHPVSEKEEVKTLPNVAFKDGWCVHYLKPIVKRKKKQ